MIIISRCDLGANNELVSFPELTGSDGRNPYCNKRSISDELNGHKRGKNVIIDIFSSKLNGKDYNPSFSKSPLGKSQSLFRFEICRINNFYDLALCVLNETTLHKLKGYVLFRSLFWTFLFNIVYHNISPIQDIKYQRLSNTILYDPLLRHIWFFRCFYDVSYY